MALKFRLAVFLVISVMLELSCVCEGQRYECIFTACTGKRDSPRSFSPESDLVPLNEYRRNRLMRLSEMLRDERNRFEDALEEKRTTARQIMPK